MREIKFRGLRKDGKGWAYGVPFHIYEEGKCFMINLFQGSTLEQEDAYFQGLEVVPSTVGQYTGIKDRNGADIYEGDVINWFGVIGLNDGQGVLRYDVENSRWELDIVGDEDDCVLLYDISFEDIQVVENIYEEGGER